MKMLVDFLALILFFAAYYITKDIKTATIVAIVIGILQSIFIYMKYKKLDGVQIASLVLIVVFGGLTVYLNNPIFIKWKPTLLYWVFAIAFLIGPKFFKQKKNIIQGLMDKEVTLPQNVWNKLNIAWVIFFIFLGVANLFVVYYWWGNDDLWVKYKTFGSMGLLIAFSILMAFYVGLQAQKYEDKKELTQNETSPKDISPKEITSNETKSTETNSSN